MGKVVDKGIDESIEKYKDLAIRLSDYLADNPEVSGKEHNSCKYIVNILRENGLDVEEQLGGEPTAFRSKLLESNDNNKPKVAILAEYDALPEIGHACGHNNSCAISILSMLSLIDLAGEDFPFNLELVGTPDEEVGGEKIKLLNKRVFDDYDYVIMAHMSSTNCSSIKLLATSDVEVTFKGKASHASAAPWGGRNALNAVQLYFNAIDMMRQQTTPDTRIHGIIKEGGRLVNIIPDKTVAYTCQRAMTLDTLNDVTERIKDCARDAAIATQTEAIINEDFVRYGDMSVNNKAKGIFDSIFEELGLDYEKESLALGSSDIGNIDEFIPAFHPVIAVSDRQIDIHTKEFAEVTKSHQAHKAIVNGAKLISKFIINTAYEPKLLDEIKEEHRNYRNRTLIIE